MLQLFYWRRAMLCLAVTSLITATSLSSGLQNEGQQVDTRINSILYWQTLAEQGLVPVAQDVPVQPAQYLGVEATDGPDVAVISGNYTQSENSIFVNPNDNTKALNSNNSTNSPFSILYGTSHFETVNSGTSWGGSFNAPGGTNSGDPAAAIGLNNRYYVGYINTSFGQGVARSTDEGATWVRNNAIAGGGTLDKNHLWVDNSAVSPYEGNLYSTWTTFGTPYGEIEIIRSTDDGVTWVNRQTISTAVPAGSHHQGVNVQTGPNGEVYAFWAIYEQWAGGQYAEDGIGFAKSTNGGVSFLAGTEIVPNLKGVRGEGSNLGGPFPIRLASFPSAAVDISGGSRNGWMYMVNTNIGVPGVNTGTNWDVYFWRSTDGGTTWSTALKVNGNVNANRKNYYPWLTCDPVTGNLSVVYHDNRNTAGNTVEVWVNNSTDGGLTWTDEFRVSDVSFTPAPIPGLAGGYHGDYIGISAYNGRVYPAWADERVGRVLTYVSPYDFEGGGGGLACGDIFFFNAKCNPEGAAQAMVKMTGDWTGETVTFDLDGDDHIINVMSNGTNSIAKLTVPHAGMGMHTVTLEDPAGCYSPVEITCNVDAPPDPEWEALLAEYEALEAQVAVRETVPTETRIIGNYPNPFNPSTTIRYALGVDSPVSVRVYNMLGQEVATLVNGFQKAGEQSVTWNGTNNFGQSVASGLYIYRLQAGNTVMTQKMLFTK